MVDNFRCTLNVPADIAVDVSSLATERVVRAANVVSDAIVLVKMLGDAKLMMISREVKVSSV